MGTHSFLNVRTYVKSGGERGIFFMKEWLSNRLATCLGPATYGLPYHYANICYKHEHTSKNMVGEVIQGKKKFSYKASLKDESFVPCREGTLNEFLLERYTAYTRSFGVKRFFRIWHEPWLQVDVDAKLETSSLLDGVFAFDREIKLVGVNYSPGAYQVLMGRPHLS